ncbi:unnamed protein product [Clonostachys chloroleuca]|uniref:Uncharacterized protein n=1 Tax=Clonostachys chloroleuca TaxID=1926264 RepID=A0AA35MBP6_9HYPO|nr:unnamed protein product [Clonostachys chloroleuca]
MATVTANTDTQIQARKCYTLTWVKFTKKYEFHAFEPSKDPSSPKGKTASYVVSSSVFNRSKPHLTLHVGPDEKTAPPVACVYEPFFTRSWKVGLGDVVNFPDAVVWEDMRKETWNYSKISWSTVRKDGTPVKLAWKRTAHHAIDGKSPSQLSARNFKLIEEDGDGSNILAVFTHTFSIRIYGSVQINVDWGDNFEYMVLMTIVTLYEAINR